MKKEQEDLRMIREMMEKSTKFLSLSGLSGILAGVTALVGAAVAYWIEKNLEFRDISFWLFMDGLFTLLIAILFGFHFSAKLAEKKGQEFLTYATKRAMYNISIPLFAGGVFAGIMLWRNEIELVLGITLVFYGLGLLNASKYTPEEIHYLGLLEVGLGLLALMLPDFDLLFWAVGFGLCHILYGVRMYKKYDSK